MTFHDWKNKKWLLKNLFVKLPCPWHELIINPPCRTASQLIAPICHEKLLQKGLSILYGEYYVLTPLENRVGVYAPSVFARKCRLRLVDILNLEKSFE